MFIFLISISGLIGILVDQIDQTQVFVRLIFPLIMMIIVIFLGGAITGLGLSAIAPLAPKRRFIYFAAIAKGITKRILIPLSILVTALIAVYSAGSFHFVWIEESEEDPLLPVSLGGEVRMDQ